MTDIKELVLESFYILLVVGAILLVFMNLDFGYKFFYEVQRYPTTNPWDFDYASTHCNRIEKNVLDENDFYLTTGGTALRKDYYTLVQRSGEWYCFKFKDVNQWVSK